MAKNIVKSVNTKGVSFGPILRYYFNRCAIAEIIDENVPLDPRRKVLTHGQASIAMITRYFVPGAATLPAMQVCQ